MVLSRKEREVDRVAVIEVGCAVILRDGKLLVAQRNEGDTCGGYWEFPGGKKEAGESLEECLVREVREELAVEIRPRKLICRHDASARKERWRFSFIFATGSAANRSASIARTRGGYRAPDSGNSNSRRETTVFSGS